MSRAIYVKVYLKKPFYDKETSDYLFAVVEEGCRRRIAVTIFEEKTMPCKKNECYLKLTDSFNFQFVTPLIGNDVDWEVSEYRPEPLIKRHQNLSKMLNFILTHDIDIVKKIEVFLTMNFDIEELTPICINPDNFSYVLEDLLKKEPELHYRFIWKN